MAQGNRRASDLFVECLEAELADLGPSWTTAACPAHVLADDVPPKASRK